MMVHSLSFCPTCPTSLFRLGRLQATPRLGSPNLPNLPNGFPVCRGARARGRADAEYRLGTLGRLGFIKQIKGLQLPNLELDVGQVGQLS